MRRAEVTILEVSVSYRFRSYFELKRPFASGHEMARDPHVADSKPAWILPLL